MNPYTAPTSESDSLPPAPSVASFLVGVVGILFTILNGLAVVGVVLNGYSLTRAAVRRLADPTELMAVIGETIIAVVSLGFLAIIPAALLYLALGPLRLRRRWFHPCALTCALYFLLLMPFGTIYGIVLLVVLRRRRAGFAAPLTSLPVADPE